MFSSCESAFAVLPHLSFTLAMGESFTLEMARPYVTVDDPNVADCVTVENHIDIDELRTWYTASQTFVVDVPIQEATGCKPRISWDSQLTSHCMLGQKERL